jgi:acyl-CoA synthetase (AMP-forming)/AMP-acid ligase II
MKQTLATLVEESSQKFIKRRALVVPELDRQVSYGELRSQILCLKQHFLSCGLKYNDVSAVVIPNGLDFVVAFLAVTTARGIAAPLNPTFTKEEFIFYLKDLNACRVIVLQNTASSQIKEAASELRIPVWEVSFDWNRLVNNSTTDPSRSAFSVVTPPPPLNSVNNFLSAQSHPLANKNPSWDNELNEADVALLLHTSGTTSKPKLVPLTHQNLVASVNNIATSYKLNETDVTIVVMPLFHVHGLIGVLLSTLYTGGCVVVPHRFSASSFWGYVKKYGVTWYSAVPTIHQILLTRAQNANDEIASTEYKDVRFRFIRSCSSALSPFVLKQLEEMFKSPVLEAYGMTEAAHQIATNLIGDRQLGTVGKGYNVEIGVFDENGQPLPRGMKGQVCIRGKNVTSGYYNNPEANRTNWLPNGWFCTGDQGFLDSDGYLTLTGRLKELINRGGEKISPFEVDAVLITHPNVSEAVSFAAPDPKYGEEVNAAVVLKDLTKNTTEEEIKKFCQGKLAEFKIPKKIFFATSLPRTATGKIQRRHVSTHFLKSLRTQETNVQHF